VQVARCALAFDVGSKRVGVAVGNTLSYTARPLRVLEAADEHALFARVDELIREWRPDCLLVGEPLTLEGTEQPATLRARRFAARLSSRFDLPVHLIDERSSSKEADRRFAQARADGRARRRDAALQDAVAAQIILERWLDAGAPLFPPAPSITPHG